VPTQRLSLTQAATASSTGTATFTFPAPATDLVYLGTLVCNGAPAGATFIATVGGTQWGSWNGTAVGGPIQALPGEQIQISATGLTAASAYNLQWIGRSDSLSETSPAYPDTNTAVASQAPGNPVQIVALVGGASQATATNGGAGTSVLLPAPTGAPYNLRHVAFVLGSGATQVEIIGHTSSFIYTVAFSSSAVLDNMAGQIVTEALDFTTIGGGGSVYLTYDQGVPTVPGGTSGGGVSNAWGQALTAKFFGSGSPIGIVLPSHLGDLYVDDVTPALWQAYGTLNTQWQQIGAPVTILATVFTANAYTLALTDAFSEQSASNGATPASITVPTNASVAFPVGTVITVTQTASGKISITAAGGVTIISSVAGGFVSGTTGCRAQSSTIGLLKTATNTWVISGDAG